MTADEFKAWRKGAGYTQGEVAELLDFVLRTVQKWESGELPVPQVVAMAITTIKPKKKPAKKS